MTSSQRAYAIDCEMVDIADENAGPGATKRFPIQVAIVDQNYRVVYNRYIKPNVPVVNDKYSIHGISQETVRRYGIPFDGARRDIKEILKNAMVVGHGLTHDLKCLALESEVPRLLRRDTALASMFAIPRPHPRRGYLKPSLANLAREHLGANIQTNHHDPAEDAITSMRLYQKFQFYPSASWAEPTIW